MWISNHRWKFLTYLRFKNDISGSSFDSSCTGKNFNQNQVIFSKSNAKKPVRKPRTFYSKNITLVESAWLAQISNTRLVSFVSKKKFLVISLGISACKLVAWFGLLIAHCEVVTESEDEWRFLHVNDKIQLVWGVVKLKSHAHCPLTSRMKSTIDTLRFFFPQAYILERNIMVQM